MKRGLLATRVPTCATIACCVLAAGWSAIEPANRQRLAALSPAHRLYLAANLNRFDRLPLAEQQRIRELDAALRTLPIEERQHYENVMRRYESWFSSLPAAGRRLIERAAPERKLAAVEQLRVDQRRRWGPSRSYQDWLQISALATESLRLEALEIRMWFALDPEQRQEIGKLATPAQQQNRLRALVRSRPALQRMREEVRKELGLELTDLSERPAATPRLDRPRMGIAKSELGRRAGEATRRAADLKAVRELDGAQVDPDRLAQFERQLPAWVRRDLDPLPADAARRRLRVLYRLVFPEPAEIEPEE